VPDHGSDDDADPRALEALAALRDGRPVGDRRALDLGVLLDWVDGLVGGRRSAVLAVATLAGVALLVVAAWWVVGRGADGRGPGAELFSAPVPTTVAPTADTAPGSELGGAAGSDEPETLVVHAAGAVSRPGLYELPVGARVDDLLVAAGGPAPGADLDRLNLATPVADGQRLWVPRIGETTPPVVAPEGASPSGADATATEADPVDLNAANEAALDELPGVGPATAAAIVGHRERNGPFATVDELLEVRGIGPAKLEALRELVVVR